MNGIGIRLMVINEQQKTCVCASFLLTNAIDQAKLNNRYASKAAKSRAEKTVLLPSKLRKLEPSLHAQRKSLPSSGSDHLVLEMISMSQGYEVQVVGS